MEREIFFCRKRDVLRIRVGESERRKGVWRFDGEREREREKEGDVWCIDSVRLWKRERWEDLTNLERRNMLWDSPCWRVFSGELLSIF
jgi:hypothetical protein